MTDIPTSTPKPPGGGGKNPLDGKVAGIPTPIVVGVIGGGLWLLYKRMNGASAGGGSSTAATDAATATADPYSAVGTGGWTATSDPEASASTPSTAITTNDQWASQAETWLLGQNYDPALTDQAVRDYVGGVNTLSTNEQALINLALKQFGPLPEVIPTTGSVAPTTPSGQSGPGYGIVTINGQQYVFLGSVGSGQVYQVGGGAPVFYGNADKVQEGSPTQNPLNAVGQDMYTPIAYSSWVSANPGGQSTYTVKAGDTLQSVALAKGMTWQQLYNANFNNIPSTHALTPGQVLEIPVISTG